MRGSAQRQSMSERRWGAVAGRLTSRECRAAPAGDVLVVVDHNHLGEQARRPLDHQGTRHRVLVVDDSAGVRQLIAATLRSKGYEVVVSSSAREAVVEMANRHFDALVVDYSMPQSNGPAGSTSFTRSS